jgi:hypothetical protein
VLARENLKRYEPTQPCAAFDVDDAATLAACESVRATQVKNGKLLALRGKGGSSDSSSMRGSKSMMSSFKSERQPAKAPILAPVENTISV